MDGVPPVLRRRRRRIVMVGNGAPWRRRHLTPWRGGFRVIYLNRSIKINRIA
jgi:hypothetical protein